MVEPAVLRCDKELVKIRMHRHRLKEALQESSLSDPEITEL